jgi:hypothetical protein
MGKSKVTPTQKNVTRQLAGEKSWKNIHIKYAGILCFHQLLNFDQRHHPSSRRVDYSLVGRLCPVSNSAVYKTADAIRAAPTTPVGPNVSPNKM